MLPAVRAAADRFILDTAYVRYMLEYLPKGGLKRPVGDGGWTVGQAIGHIALSHAMYADMIERLLGGDSSLPPGFDPPRVNTEGAVKTAKWSAAEIRRQLDSSLNRLINVLERITPAQHAAAIGPFPLKGALEGWSAHIAVHGLDLADALPELRFDPMVLNWLLYVDFSDSPERFERQQKLFEDARAYFREIGEDDDVDDEDNG